MSEIDWFYIKDGAPVGPVPHRQFCAMFATGELRLDTMIFCEQFRDWTPAAKVGGFRKFAEMAPPPPLPVPGVPPPPPPPWQAQASAAQAGPQPSPVSSPFDSPVAAAPASAPPVPLAPPPPPPPSSPSAWGGPTLSPPYEGATETETVYDTDGHAMTVDPLEAWNRWWARGIDSLIVGLVCGVITALLRWDGYFATYAFSFGWVLVEPLLLCTWGSTFGKSILGFTVRRNDGARLSYGQALKRTLVVYVKGLALNIPFLNVITQIMAFNHLTAMGQAVWDEEGGFKCRQASFTGGRLIAAAVATVLILGLMGATSVARSIDDDRRAAAEDARQFEEFDEEADGAWADADDE